MLPNRNKNKMQNQDEKTENVALHEGNLFFFFREISNSLKKSFNNLKSMSSLYPVALVNLYGNMQSKNNLYLK